MPHLPLAAWLLNEACGGAEAGKGVGKVLAGEVVSVVLAHGGQAWGPAPWSCCGWDSLMGLDGKLPRGL